jgi:hypothetical protein
MVNVFFDSGVTFPSPCWSEDTGRSRVLRRQIQARTNASVVVRRPFLGTISNSRQRSSSGRGQRGGDFVVLASEDQLELWDLGAAGSRTEPRWRIHQRARNLVPPAWCALGAAGDRIAAGLTSGALCWVDPADGKRSPEVALGHGEVAQLAALDADRLVALCGDGTVVGLARGAIAWQAAPPARESPAHARLLVSGAHALVDWPGAGLTVLDAASGKALGVIAAAVGAAWSAGGDDVLIGGERAVSLIRIGAR